MNIDYKANFFTLRGSNRNTSSTTQYRYETCLNDLEKNNTMKIGNTRKIGLNSDSISKVYRSYTTTNLILTKNAQTISVVPRTNTHKHTQARKI